MLHVASPFPPAQPKNPDELIVPARDGTLRVLRASVAAGVKRIVVTSSVAAVRNGPDGQTRPRADRGRLERPRQHRMTPYSRSKTIAELAAWEYMREQGAEHQLVTVQPGAIMGPLLGADRSYSLQAVERHARRADAGHPAAGLQLHRRARRGGARGASDDRVRAGGQRLIAAGAFLWLSDVAAILRERLGADAAKVPPRRYRTWLCARCRSLIRGSAP